MKTTDYNPFEDNESDKGSSGSNREDSGRETRTGADRFVKDKRRRIVRVEKNPRPESAGHNQAPKPATERPHSYNPNFSADNKPLFSKDKSRDQQGSDSRPRSSERSYNRGDDSSSRDFNRSSAGQRSYNREPDYNRPSESQPRSRDYNRDQDYNRDRDHNRGNDYSRFERSFDVRIQEPEERDFNRDPSYYRNNERPARTEQRGGQRYQDRERTPARRNDSNRDRDSRPAGRGPAKPYAKPYGKPDARTGGPRKPGYGDKPRAGGRNQGAPQSRYTPENYPKYPRQKLEEEIRLNRYLSMSGICSRREADDIIRTGVVSVNEQVVTELGTKVSPGDVVKYNGVVIHGESKVYIVMNKPKGYVTTIEDPHADKTVMDLLKGAVKERVYPVGRLDKNSLGVLLITNDGDMTKKLTHPGFSKKKIYHVSLDRSLAKADMERIVEGITLDDGEIRADAIDYVGDSRREVGIEIHSGRNRIIRRIFEHLGYQVQKLDRVYFAGLTKKNLKRGAWRFLSSREVDTLHSGKYE